MLADMLLRSVVRGALGARRKPYRHAARFLTGGRSPVGGLGLNLGTLLGAAGVAWGAYEVFQSRRSPETLTTVAGGGFPASSAPPPPLPSATLPPPLPDAASPSSPRGESSPEALRRLVALSIAAARCDRELGEEEYARIREAARESGGESFVSEELSRKRPLAEIVAGAQDAQLKADLYVLAFGIVRADGGVSGGERAWLAELAGTLGLDAATTAALERKAGELIDRSPP